MQVNFLSIPTEVQYNIVKECDPTWSHVVCKAWSAIALSPSTTYAWLEKCAEDFRIPHAFKKVNSDDTVEKKLKFITDCFLKHRVAFLNPPKPFPSTPSYVVLQQILAYEKAKNLSIILKTLNMDKLVRACEKVKIINLWDKNITYLPDELNLFTNLEKFTVGLCQISSLPPQFGSAWTKLQYIQINFTKIVALPAGFGKFWQGLEAVVLTNNKLEVLPYDFGEAWCKLWKIELSDNPLKFLPPNFGKSWGLLYSLDITNTKLKELQDDFGLVWKNLAFFYVRGNPDLKINIQRLISRWSQLKRADILPF